MAELSLDDILKVPEKDESTDWLKILEKVDKIIDKPIVEKFINKLFNKGSKNVDTIDNVESGYVTNPQQKQLPSQKQDKSGVKKYEITADGLYKYMLDVLDLVIIQEGEKVTVMELLSELKDKKKESISLIEKML